MSFVNKEQTSLEKDKFFNDFIWSKISLKEYITFENLIEKNIYNEEIYNYN